MDLLSKNNRLHIGFIRSSSIGDVILATACIDFLKKTSIDHHIIWFGTEPTLSLLKESFEGITAINFKEKSTLELFSNIPPIDILIDLQGSFKSKIFSILFSLIKRKKTFSCKKNRLWRSFLVLVARIVGRKKVLPFAYKKNNKQFESMLLALKEALFFQLKSKNFLNDLLLSAHPVLSFTKTSEDPILRDLKSGTWLAVAPGASFHPKKMPSEKLITILRDIQKIRLQKNQTIFGLIFLGDKKDIQDSQIVKNQIDWQGPVLDMTGQMNLIQTSKALNLTSGILSNDSGLAHIAEALGKPSFVIFGPTIESFGFAPWKETSRAFSVKIGCRPCSKHGQKTCRFGDQKCFDSISSVEVASYIENVLEQDLF